MYIPTKDKFDRPILGGVTGTYIRKEKHFNLQNAKLVLLVLVLVFVISFYFPVFLYRNRIEINRSTRTRCETCSKLTITAPFIVNFEIYQSGPIFRGTYVWDVNCHICRGSGCIFGWGAYIPGTY